MLKQERCANALKRNGGKFVAGATTVLESVGIFQEAI